MISHCETNFLVSLFNEEDMAFDKRQKRVATLMGMI